MERLIFDTSVWIGFFRKDGNAGSILLKDTLSSDSDPLICPIIIQEILQGIKEDNQYNVVRESLLALPILHANQLDACIGAASIYRSLRKVGVTIRKPNDCLIAWYALEFDLVLVHNDHDFDQIGLHFPLQLYSSADRNSGQ